MQEKAHPKPQQKQDKPRPSRDEQLAQRLRENLRRRKQPQPEDAVS